MLFAQYVAFLPGEHGSESGRRCGGERGESEGAVPIRSGETKPPGTWPGAPFFEK